MLSEGKARPYDGALPRQVAQTEMSMPRYFFHVKDGSDYPDLQGTELADLASARNEALRFAGHLLSETGERFWASGEWRMCVQDEGGRTLFELAFQAIDAAAASR